MIVKDVGIRIRVEKELREAFQAACAREKLQASEVLRAFMQTYVESHDQRKQRDLFGAIADADCD